MKKGFVVKKENIKNFLTEKLTILGLNEIETNDFIKAWIDDFKDSSFYFISFYPQEIIEKYAPIKTNPEFDTVIRILMDYRKIDNNIKVESLEFDKTPVRKASTLVEWGGLKR